MILNRYRSNILHLSTLIMSSLVIEMELIEVKRRGYLLLLQGSEVLVESTFSGLAKGKRMTFTKE